MSLLFLLGTRAFLHDDTYTLGAWLFVGSAPVLANSPAAAFDRSRS